MGSKGIRCLPKEEAIFNCIDLVKMIVAYRAERGEGLGFSEVEFTPDTWVTVAR